MPDQSNKAASDIAERLLSIREPRLMELGRTAAAFVKDQVEQITRLEGELRGARTPPSELRELSEGASPGSLRVSGPNDADLWISTDSRNGFISKASARFHTGSRADASFWVAAVNYVRAMLAASPLPSREEIARIVDPWAFKQCEWAIEQDDDNVLRRYIPDRDRALEKAGRILSLLQGTAG